MYEVRLHGRGGQGAVMAAGMLASAVVAEGKFAVAIPSFGFERRGAPVVAFLRTDANEIRRMTNITNPDCVICIDPTVSRSVNIFAGMRSGGALVLATGKPLSSLVLPDTVATVGLIDAVRIASEIFRRPITNTLMLGAFARTTGIVSLDALKQTLLESEFRDAGLDQNLAALDRGYNEVRVHRLGSKVAA
jgi:phenylglyoxylate dehydrogenase gamma subunit